MAQKYSNFHNILKEKFQDDADGLSFIESQLFGRPCETFESSFDDELNCEVAHDKFEGQSSIGGKRMVKIAAIQNSIPADTTLPIDEQLRINVDRIFALTKKACEEGAQIICLQEACSAPFFFCLREKWPWTQFAEDYIEGPTVSRFYELSRDYKNVIILPILERAQHDIIWNTAVILEDGEVLGRTRKSHIPRIGDFNEGTYYRYDRNMKFPVFKTKFGNVAVQICYARHFPLCWEAYAINGAEFIFNPSATVDGLSESLWPIEARSGAVANSVYTIAINRIGTEHYESEFTSGNGKPAHKDFGHFYGSSFVTAPNSHRTPSLSRDKDGILIVDCDLNIIKQVRDVWNFQMAHRREDYAELLAASVDPEFQPNIQ
ncbi:hypothetical protein PCE1_004010 [Barthelona sp. PCE]